MIMLDQGWSGLIIAAQTLDWSASIDKLQVQLVFGHLTNCDQFSPVTKCDQLWLTFCLSIPWCPWPLIQDVNKSETNVKIGKIIFILSCSVKYLHANSWKMAITPSGGINLTGQEEF